MRSPSTRRTERPQLVAGGDDELAGKSMEIITQDRDRVLLELMRLKAEAEQLP
jgi:hypothetical protein